MSASELIALLEKYEADTPVAVQEDWWNHESALCIRTGDTWEPILR